MRSSCFGIVPFVERAGARRALRSTAAGSAASRDICEHLRALGLSDAGRPFDQQRLLERDRQLERDAQLVSRQRSRAPAKWARNCVRRSRAVPSVAK